MNNVSIKKLASAINKLLKKPCQEEPSQEKVVPRKTMGAKRVVQKYKTRKTRKTAKKPVKGLKM